MFKLVTYSTDSSQIVCTLEILEHKPKSQLDSTESMDKIQVFMDHNKMIESHTIKETCSNIRKIFLHVYPL